MGGFGSGGRRVGAGRKSKRTEERRLSGARDRTKAIDAGVPDAPVDVPMPDGLTDEQQSAWRELWPHAAKAGTLTEASASAFRDLCEVVALRRSITARVLVEGLMVDGLPHPLIVQERQYRLREEAGKAAFMLRPLGKPLAQAEPQADPFAEFEGPQLAVSNG